MSARKDILSAGVKIPNTEFRAAKTCRGDTGVARGPTNYLVEATISVGEIGEATNEIRCPSCVLI